MTDREKQIEEIRNILPSNDLIKATYDDIDFPRYLYDYNCRIIPEGAVVLTSEEMKHPTRTEVIEFFVNHNAQVRKETAREILGLYSLSDTFSSFQEKVAKQFDIEIKE